MATKAQGLPMNAIVLAAIAMLVLVVVLGFATGSFNRLFKSVKTLESVTPEQVSGFKIGCDQACFAEQQLTRNPIDFSKSEYCTKVLKNATRSLNCWDVGTSCNFNVASKKCGGPDII